MKKSTAPELLAPAGDFNKMLTAFHFGASAVYLGGKSFGLRAHAGNFTNDELTRATATAHSMGKRVYVTLNTFARNDEFPALIEYARFLESIGVDAVIVSDLGVMSAIRQNTKLPIHISTQANTVNKHTAMEYAKLGATRIILARECSLDEITEIATYLKGKAEVETFVHGAMCISYSGRCLLSNYLTGRDANRGSCAGSCRWKYNLVEEKRPGQYLPIEQDGKGTYILNSKDMCLIDHMDKLQKAGVTSFKIEGRMKSEYYLAGVVNAYRRKLGGEKHDYTTELAKISNRHYTTGFTIPTDEPMQDPTTNSAIQTHDVVAIVTGKNTVTQRNVFEKGDTLEVLSPCKSFNKCFTVTKITDTKNNEITRANVAEQALVLDIPYALSPMDILRKIKSPASSKSR